MQYSRYGRKDDTKGALMLLIGGIALVAMAFSFYFFVVNKPEYSEAIPQGKLLSSLSSMAMLGLGIMGALMGFMMLTDY